MLIKVCGMGDADNIAELSQLAIDYIGFIFYKESPRYVGGILKKDDLSVIPSNIKKVGVFVNEDVSTIINISEEYGLNIIQLHGDETKVECKELKKRGFEVWKAFQVRDEKDIAHVKTFDKVCDKFLFDTPSVMYGGSGQKFEWQLLEHYNGKTPFMLSGGIGPVDLEKVMEFKHPKLIGIDVNSRFESEPAMKRISLLEQFIMGIRFYE